MPNCARNHLPTAFITGVSKMYLGSLAKYAGIPARIIPTATRPNRFKAPVKLLDMITPYTYSIICKQTFAAAIGVSAQPIPIPVDTNESQTGNMFQATSAIPSSP